MTNMTWPSVDDIHFRASHTDHAFNLTRVMHIILVFLHCPDIERSTSSEHVSEESINPSKLITSFLSIPASL